MLNIKLIQFFHNYRTYLEAVSSIHNLRTHHAMVTRDPWESFVLQAASKIIKNKMYKTEILPKSIWT
jgi:hypothetical protein